MCIMDEGDRLPKQADNGVQQGMSRHTGTSEQQCWSCLLVGGGGGL